VSEIKYSLVRSRRRLAGITISVGVKGVVVRAPVWMPVWAIDKFVTEKRSWIEFQLKKIPPVKKETIYQDGQSLLYLGKPHSLKIHQSDQPSRTQVVLEEGKILVVISGHFVGSAQLMEVKKSITRWYLSQGIEHLTQKVTDIAKNWGFNMPKSHSKTFRLSGVVVHPKII
jgi:predicted metal-dependent hydrolase